MSESTTHGLRIDRSLLAQAKSRAASSGKTCNQFFVDAIEFVLSHNTDDGTGSQQVAVRVVGDNYTKESGGNVLCDNTEEEYAIEAGALFTDATLIKLVKKARELKVFPEDYLKGLLGEPGCGDMTVDDLIFTIMEYRVVAGKKLTWGQIGDVIWEKFHMMFTNEQIKVLAGHGSKMSEAQFRSRGIHRLPAGEIAEEL